MSANARPALKSSIAGSVQQLIARYRQGELSRREFFQMLAFTTGSILLARDIMLAEGFASEWEAYNWPDAATPQGQTAPTPKESIEAGEKRLPANVEAEWVKYPSGEVPVGAYLARPKAGAPFAAIIVIHENRGLTEFVLDIAQRWAGEDLLAIAVDFLSRLGGTASFPTMEAAGREGIGRLERTGVVADLHATVAYLKTRADVRKNKIGVSGFCWGGGQTFHFATESNEIAFAMPFYGGAPPLERLERIACPIFAVYAEQDPRINANIEAVDAKMKELGKNYAYKIFPGTQHAFMNFTAPQRYNAEQARAAWSEVTAFAKKMIA
jgi:carboxymethylenebutenolidase